MPMGDGFFGTNAQGSQTQEYCKFCYVNGVFTEPSLTLQDMVYRSIEQMKKELSLPEEQAKVIAVTTIPQLKRWKR